MNMEIITKDVVDKNSWEKFIGAHPEANFLSSWNWGVFQEGLGKQVFYRGYYSSEQLLGVSLIIQEDAKRGRYLTCAGGPILDWQVQKLVHHWCDDVRTLAHKQDAAFVRVRPQIHDTSNNHKLFADLGFKPSPMHLTADLTLQLDLELSLDELLAQMRKSTRYEIRQAQKLGVVTRESTDPAEIELFHQHQLALATKHGFVPFSLDFLKRQFQVFAADGQACLIHAYFQDKLLASAFVIYYGSEAVYHYGISTPDNQKLPGAYAVQWAAIARAKELGIKRYNFWGIAPEGSQNHRFAGVSLFKRGFGGKEVAYLKAHDLPVKSSYLLTKLFEQARAKYRHLE